MASHAPGIFMYNFVSEEGILILRTLYDENSICVFPFLLKTFSSFISVVLLTGVLPILT